MKKMHLKAACGLFAALALGAGLVLFAASPAEAQRRNARAAPAIDLSTPEGAMMASRRIWCTMTDNEPVYWFWQGEAYGRRQGEKDRLLFKVEGINVRTCAKMSDPQRGDYVRSVSRELLLYIDPQTNKVLSKWTNPYTNEVVDVLHVANDPVNGDFAKVGRGGQPTRWSGFALGDQWHMVSTVPLFYSNPLAGDYQQEIGGLYHATEMFSFSGKTADLLDTSRNFTDATVTWSRMSDWLPWMKMAGREGMIYFHTAGRKLARYEDVSQLMRDEIAKSYPDYRNPPPVTDQRPNETSWTYFKKVREGAIQAPKRN